MLAPLDLSRMKLGCRFNPASFHPRVMAAKSFPPPAYSRIMETPLVAGDNATVGDCVETMGCNAAATFLGREAAPSFAPIPDETAIEIYSAVTGYTPTNPASDQGTDPEVFFAWWQKNSIAGVRLSSAVPIAPFSPFAIQQAISTTGGVFLCVALSIEQQQQTEWVPEGTPGSWGQHAVWCDSYDGGWFFVTSWGQRYPISVAYFQAPGFVAGAYALDLERA